MTFLLTFYVVSFYSLMSSFSFDSHTPGKRAVFKCSGFLPTADCYLKCSPRMCALVKEFIPSPFFHTEQGFNQPNQEEPAWPHQGPSTQPVLHPAGSLLPSLHNFPPPPPSSAPSSFLPPQPARCHVLGFVIMSNMALSRAQLGCRGWCCCTRVAEVFALCRKMCLSIQSYPFLSRKSFHILFPYSKDFSLES